MLSCWFSCVPEVELVNLQLVMTKFSCHNHVVRMLKGEHKMSKQENGVRVLSRAGARIITQEELARVSGGDEGHLPTSTLSRDATGRPIDITQD